MKRFLLLVMSFMLLFSLAVTASAEDGIYENAGELYEAWVSRDEVPDYITAVWSSDGGAENLTFGVIEGENGELAKQEILRLIRNDCTVTFVVQKYSRNYLYQIQDKICDAYFDKGLGLMSAGVSEYQNQLHFEVKESYAENPDTLDMIRTVTEQYGDAVSFRFTDSEIVAVVGTDTAVAGPDLVVANPANQIIPIGFTLGIGSVLIAYLLLVEIRRRQMAALSSDGTTSFITERVMTAKEVEAAIRKTELQPSQALDDRVMRSIRSTDP